MYRSEVEASEAKLFQVASLVAIVPFLGFWLYGLFDLDEGFYAAVVRHMLDTGNWIIPKVQGQPWFEKPILLYWVTAPSVAAFGDVIGPRLPSVMASIATIWICGAWVFRRFGASAGAASMMVLSTSLIFAAAGRMLLTDPVLVLCFTGCLLAFDISLTDGVKWRWVAGGLLGATVLAKGPVSCVLFVVILVLLIWREPEQRKAMRGGWLVGVLAFVLVVASWYVPAYLRARDQFVQDFLIAQNIGRFAGGDKAHAAPIWAHPIFYPVVILVGMAPWSFSMFRRSFWNSVGLEGEAATSKRFLVRWALVVIVFYSLSGSKLPHYVLAAVPPLAMLVGVGLTDRWRSSEKLRAWTFGWAGALCMILTAGFSWWYTASGHAELHALAREAATRSGGRPVIAFEMTWRNSTLQGGSLQLRETSHPSLELYLGSLYQSAESLLELPPTEFLMITPANRLDASDPESKQLGRRAKEIVTGLKSARYQLWDVAPLAPPSR